jgi:hypothetical protein
MDWESLQKAKARSASRMIVTVAREQQCLLSTPGDNHGTGILAQPQAGVSADGSQCGQLRGPPRALRFGRPLQCEGDVSRVAREDRQGEFASELLLWAAGLSSTAMFLAVAGWIFS